MAALNEHVSVLAAMVNDTCDHSDANFIYILSANTCQQQIRKNDRKNTLEQTKHQTKSQFVYKDTSHVTKAGGIEVFMVQNMRALSREQVVLVKDCSRKSGSIQERSLTTLAPRKQIGIGLRVVRLA